MKKFEVNVKTPDGFEMTIRFPESNNKRTYADAVDISATQHESIGNEDFDKDLKRSGLGKS